MGDPPTIRAESASRFARITQGPAYKWWALAAVQSGNLMAVIDGGIVNIALPTLLREFGVDIETVKWVSVAYLLTVTVTLLTIGRLADMLGRKRIAVAGFAIFTLSSGLCGAAPTLEALVGFRVLQGLGAACMMANTMAIMAAIFPQAERGRAMSIHSSVVAVAQMIGPTLGGVLVSTVGWRWIFFVNLPIGLLGIALATIVLREDRISPARRAGEAFDLAGAVLSALGVGFLFVVFERFADAHVEATTFALLVAGLAALVVFVAVERRVPSPLVALQLFQARAFTFGSAATAFALLASAATAFVMPFYLQTVLGYSPMVAGILVTPTAIGIVIGGWLAGWLASRVGPHLLATAGLGCGVAAIVWLSLLRVDSHYVDVALRLLLLGLGLGLFHPPNNVSVLRTVPPERLGIASAFQSTMRILGQFLGASLSAEMLGTHLENVGGVEALHADPEPSARERIESVYVDAQAFALQAAAVLTLVGVLVSAARGRSPREG